MHATKASEGGSIGACGVASRPPDRASAHVHATDPHGVRRLRVSPPLILSLARSSHPEGELATDWLPWAQEGNCRSTEAFDEASDPISYADAPLP
jgi:hypothetical protein